jgi:hypothetical protein
MYGACRDRGYGILRTLLVAIALFGLATPPAFGAHEWRISAFRDTINLKANGEVTVQEDLTLCFSGSFQGIHRTIPIESTSPLGKHSLVLEVREVTDGSGHALRYEITHQDAYQDIKIYIPGALDATRTVRIVYWVPNAVRYFADHDQFSWNVTGNEWPVTIEKASAVINLPPSAAGRLWVQAYTGAYGSREQKVHSDTGASTITVETTDALPIRNGLTVDIRLAKGVLHEPGSLWRAGWFLRRNLVLLLPVLAMAVMLGFRRYKGLNAKAGLSLVPIYEPPEQLSPAEMGALVESGIVPRHLTSTIIDLAVRGFFKIEEYRASPKEHSKDYVFHRLKDKLDWIGLADHERTILEKLLGDERSVHLSELTSQLHSALPVIEASIWSSLIRKGMYLAEPKSARIYLLPAVIMIAMPVPLLHFIGFCSLFDSLWIAALAIALAVLVVWLLGRRLSIRSRLGTRTRQKILGFREFLSRVDSDHVRRLPMGTFEKHLSYAMAFGVEAHWSKAFRDVVFEPPHWYAGSHLSTAWDSLLLANLLDDLSAKVYLVLTTTPHPSAAAQGVGAGSIGGGSSNSGGAGGNFSGGGFGGVGAAPSESVSLFLSLGAGAGLLGVDVTVVADCSQP